MRLAWCTFRERSRLVVVSAVVLAIVLLPSTAGGAIEAKPFDDPLKYGNGGVVPKEANGSGWSASDWVFMTCFVVVVIGGSVLVARRRAR
jgi:hypothetical protein